MNSPTVPSSRTNEENPGNCEAFASPDFWKLYRRLPTDIRELADKNFELLKRNPNHPSLHFKKIGKYRSARVGLRYRALAVEIPEGLLWFWIGNHSDYDKLLG